MTGGTTEEVGGGEDGEGYVGSSCCSEEQQQLAQWQEKMHLSKKQVISLAKESDHLIRCCSDHGEFQDMVQSRK